MHDAGVVPGLVGGQPVLLLEDGDIADPGLGQGAGQRDPHDAAANNSDSFSHAVVSFPPGLSTAMAVPVTVPGDAVFPEV
jgi:hypothetical protein